MAQESLADGGLRPAERRGLLSQLSAIVQLLRPHHWVKNLLLFVPLITSHDWSHAGSAAIGFTLFCLVASAVYIINDLMDVRRDRQHPTKHSRPIASNRVSVGTAGTIAVVLLVVAIGCSIRFMPDMRFTYVLLGYIVLTFLYSLYLREVLFMDVLLLAGLFGYRVAAGGIAASIEISDWLLAFSGFFFLSIAFAKRFTELAFYSDKGDGDDRATGRGYRSEDLPLIRTLGPLCGYLSVLIFCLYISEVAKPPVYEHPRFLWLICPLLLYWITRLWFVAHRRQLDDDPVVFAMRDWRSYAIAAIGLLLLILAIG